MTEPLIADVVWYFAELLFGLIIVMGVFSIVAYLLKR
jgi:hypothetical protein